MADDWTALGSARDPKLSFLEQLLSLFEIPHRRSEATLLGSVLLEVPKAWLERATKVFDSTKNITDDDPRYFSDNWTWP